MKKQTLLLVVAVAICGVLNSCQKKEQSQFTMDSIKGYATIQGSVVYDEGAKVQAENANVVVLNNTVPSVGQMVMVSVAYDEYSEGAAGVKVFETIVDESGRYSIDIPVGVSAIEVTVDVKPFNADYFALLNNGIETIVGALYNDASAVGTATSLSLTLSENNVKVIDMEVDTNDNIVSTALTTPVTIGGSVYVRSEMQVGDVLTATGRATVPCEATIKFSQTTGSPEEDDSRELNDSREIVYVVDVDVNGNYEIDASFYNGWDYADVRVEVSVEQFYNPNLNFTHYYYVIASRSFRVENLKGIYESLNSSMVTGLSHLFQEGSLMLLMPELELEFNPLNRYSIKGIGNSSIDNPTGSELLYGTNNVMDWAL